MRILAITTGARMFHLLLSSLTNSVSKNYTQQHGRDTPYSSENSAKAYSELYYPVEDL